MISKKRPLGITIICVLSVLGSVFIIASVFSGLASTISAWFPIYLSFLVVLELFCTLGLWNMQKWAAYLYCGIVVATTCVSFLMGNLTFIQTLLSALAFYSMIHYSKQMK